MVFFNYATMQMAAKIVYYGPGLCGKTTNLHYIYAKTSPQSRGEMVSLETETDRTLFFDLLPIDVGVIGGFKTRLQLYTIPGQVFYNTTRKLVLKGVDGIVFVADSQNAMMEANLESLKNLRDNLTELGVKIEDIPLVMQFNKRDLPNVADIDTLRAHLDPDYKHDFLEAVAATGVGVFETLKQISKLTLRTLRSRMTGEEAVKVAPRRGEFAAFRVKEPPSAGHEPRPAGSTTAIGTTAPPTALAGVPAAAASVAAKPAEVAAAAMPAQEEVEEIESSREIGNAEQAFTDSTLAKTADIDARIISDAPVAAAPPPPPAPEPEIEIPQSAKPAKKPPEVKHVKMRSSVDVMAELEALRKRATQSPSKQQKKETGSNRHREIQKTINLQIPAGVLPKTRSLRVTVDFVGSDSVVQSQKQSIDLGDTSDAQSLSVNLKIDE
jgi:signal recognition particle receptor subunit beta